jgi:S-adenosylmethionine:tRNA ribosyltransferase-isomerase
MVGNEWNYHLPPELIAQEPLEDRAASRLLVYDRSSGGIAHKRFREISGYINPSECLVLNSSRVIAARLYGTKTETGGRVEVFILRHMGNNRFHVLLKPRRKVRVGKDIEFKHGIRGRLINRAEEYGEDIFELDPPPGLGLFEAIETAGTVPLPPYIKRDLDNPQRYQTVYADRPGSVAAPTAGLHFTNELITALEYKGVQIARLDLKISWGTFSKVTDAQLESGSLHPEEVEISGECADIINITKQKGGRIIACGTTSVRALEASAKLHGQVRPTSGSIDLFIHPGFEFRVVDAMITNFHLPGTSLLMLVAAFMGRDAMFAAYEEAMHERYRFYSFGDAMLII